MKEAKADSKKAAEKRSEKASTGAKSKNASESGAPDLTGDAKKKSETGKSKNQAQNPATGSPGPQVVDQEPQLPTTHAKLGVFGGPKDRGIKPDDKLALPTGPHGVYERVRSLNPKSFYCSMRWNYHVQHLTPEEVKRWWANKKLLLTNPKNSNAVVVRAVDYGPHENTGLDIGISPGAAEALAVEAGDEIDIALADSRAPLGKQ
ncbi:MAG: hypothetical protein WAV20_01355 [Blastocatellia bacterium]